MGADRFMEYEHEAARNYGKVKAERDQLRAELTIINGTLEKSGYKELAMDVFHLTLERDEARRKAREYFVENALENTTLWRKRETEVFPWLLKEPPDGA